MTTGNAQIKANVAARSIAQVGLARDENHNYYLDGRGPITSVTTILKVVDKSGPLVGWAKRITAEAAVRHAAELPAWVKDFGDDGAVGMLTKASNVIRDKAANAGSEIHTLAEAIVKGSEVEVPVDLAPYVNSFLRWRTDFEPEYLAAEEMVYSHHGYAGTFDAICRIAGETWMLDYKTSKGVYAETALQLAAYAAADFIGRPGDPNRYAIPAVDQFGVVHIRPEGAELVPFDVTGAFDAFLAFKRGAEWRLREGIVGQPVGPALLHFPAPAKEAVA
jgi:hypothetical protein